MGNRASNLVTPVEGNQALPGVGDPATWAPKTCLLYTSDAADERSSVDLGGRRIIKKKNKQSRGSERQLESQKRDDVDTRVKNKEAEERRNSQRAT